MRIQHFAIAAVSTALAASTVSAKASEIAAAKIGCIPVAEQVAENAERLPVYKPGEPSDVNLFRREEFLLAHSDCLLDFMEGKLNKFRKALAIAESIADGVKR